jgi:hypothetical protein
MNIKHDYSTAADRFGLVARQYCSLVESTVTLDKTEFLLQLYRTIPDLIAEAIRLPEVDFDEDEGIEKEARIRQIRAKTQMKEEEWGRLYNSLKERLGEQDLYWQVFDPRTDNEAIRGSLADDIADVYRDLKNGIAFKDTNNAPPSEVIFDWRLLFQSHWGKHAIDAFRTVHFLLEEHWDS